MALSSFLSKIDKKRDQILIPWLKRFWPSFIKPNHLTLVRLIIAGLILFSLLSGYQIKSYLIFLYLLAVILDIIDGSLARGLNLKTRSGAFWDPVADKLLNLSILAYFLWPTQILILSAILIPEIITLIGSGFFLLMEKTTTANLFGKVKMTLQSIAILLILIFSINLISVSLLWLSVFASIVSLFKKYQEKNDKN